MFFKYEIAEEIKAPNPILEPFILKSAKSSYFYAKQVLKMPWKEAEPILLDSMDPEYAYLYAKNVLKKRWPEAEKYILEASGDADLLGTYGAQKARDVSALYAKNVIKGRWKEAESFIANSPNLIDYISRLSDDETKEFKNMIMLEGINNSMFAKHFFSWKPTHRIKMPGRRAFEVMKDEIGCDRWGHSNNQGIATIRRLSAKPTVSFVRMFTLKEWLTQASFTSKGTWSSLEYCEYNKSWYWKRQANFGIFDQESFDRLKKYAINPTVELI